MPWWGELVKVKKWFIWDEKDAGRGKGRRNITKPGGKEDVTVHGTAEPEGAGAERGTGGPKESCKTYPQKPLRENRKIAAVIEEGTLPM